VNSRRTLSSAFALAGALALLASPALRAMDDWERRVNIHPDTLIRGVSIPTAFKGLDGKSQPAGLYDFDIEQRGQGILIGLLRNGKRVAEVPGKFVPGEMHPPDPTKPGQTQLQSFHFDASSKVGFEYGGLKGKVSCSNNLHPGGANLGSISFLLPAMQVQGK
jgi:hypothetical protein